MSKLPRSIRFFRKPDHISFLIGYTIILAVIPTNSIILKIIGTLFFAFTLCYETYEISQGNRQIVKLDHITFIIAFIILLFSFWYDFMILLVLSAVLFGFTLGYEIFSVWKRDQENKKKT